MRLLQPDPGTALRGLRAMKTVAAASGAIGSAQRTLLQAVRDVLLHLEPSLDDLAPIDPAALAAGFPEGPLRRQFVDGMLVVALADGVPDRATVAQVEAFAAAADVDAAELRDLRRLADHHMLLFKLDFLRRSQVGDILRNQLDQHGLLGLARSVLGMRGLMEDPALASRYHAWERLPDDTLGHHLWRYYRRNGFGLPGERGGFPEAGVYHDVSHVLAGYGTDAEGEIEVAAFIAGYKTQRPFYVVLFAVLIFSAGVNMRPTPGDVTTGVLGRPGMAERMFAALERGASVRADLSDKWDYWPWVGRPIEEVRQALAVPPA